MQMTKLSFRIEPDILSSLEEIVKRDNLSLSEFIRQAVLEYLIAHESH